MGIVSTREQQPSTFTAGRWVFDVAVVVAVASAIYQVVTGHFEPAVRFGVIALIMLGTRWGNVPVLFAAGFAASLLLATWASVEHWYRAIAPADEVVHFITPGALAAAAYFLLVNFRVMPGAAQARRHLRSWTPVFWVTLVGVLAAVLWEFYEWSIEQVNPAGMRVGYTDTIFDLLAGMLGSMTAGLVALWWSNRHEHEELRNP